MTVNSQRLLLAAAGAAAAGEALYVDDVFSTYLYEGTGSTLQTITNGIDLSGEGGMVWFKQRDSPSEFAAIVDTERGRTKVLYPSDTYAEFTTTNSSTHDLISFNSDGFTLGNTEDINANHLTKRNVSWTFRKAPGFFDVVTYTGTGANRSIAHSLGSVPGCILIKCTSRAGDDWIVYHRSLGNTKFLNLNQLYAASTDAAAWNSSTPTSTVFYLGDKGQVNDSNQTYVAYIFAHDDQSFGEDEDESIIKCGSYTGTGSSGNAISLGFEPQWILIKNAGSVGGWFIWDAMRGLPVGDLDSYLRAESSSAEVRTSADIDLNSTGFTITNASSGYINTSGVDYIYMAIRRPHKPPEAGTDVFKALTVAASEAGTKKTTDFVVDLSLQRVYRTGTGYSGAYDRLRGSKELRTSAASAETTASFEWDFNDGYIQNFSNLDGASWNFRRAPGFFDMVAYTGTGSNRTVNHNLGVAPELMIFKDRTTAYNWGIFAQPLGNTKFLEFNTDLEQTSSTIWNNTSPSSSAFALGTNVRVNSNGDNHVAYLFATLSGISKVGSYTGTGSNIGVDCGFTAGARFVLIKRTDSTGDWYVYDSTRGIVGGNDPYLLLNSTAAEVTTTDYIDPLNSGFTVTSSAPAALNASGGTYIFLAIA